MTPSILDEAQRILAGPRQEDYGDPVEAHRRVAGAWSAILDHPVAAHEVALCMAALKLVRATTSTERDSLIDAVGYVAIADRCSAHPGCGTSDCCGECPPPPTAARAESINYGENLRGLPDSV